MAKSTKSPAASKAASLKRTKAAGSAMMAALSGVTGLAALGAAAKRPGARQTALGAAIKGRKAK